MRGLLEESEETVDDRRLGVTKVVSEVSRALLSVGALAAGCIALGAGMKFTLYWWGCLPNFIDGICWVVASALCVCYTLRYSYSYLRGK